MINKKVISFLLGMGFFSSFSAYAQEDSLTPIQELSPKKVIQYQWADFLMGKTCSDDFNYLENQSFLTSNQEKLKLSMQDYCLGKMNVWNHLLMTFYSNKKNLLIDKTLKKNGPIMRYVKAVPYWLVNIHCFHPQGDSLTAKLDRIENAIQNRDPENVLFLIQDLTPQQQIFLISLFNEASQLIAFKKTLEQENNHD